MKTFFMCYF